MITAKKVTKEYSAKRALDAVDLCIPKGSIYGLLGPNGAGKTSFIRIMNQITAPDDGAVYLEQNFCDPVILQESGIYLKSGACTRK